MGKPIDTNTDPAALAETDNIGTTEPTEDVRQATDAFRAAMAEASDSPDSQGIERVVMETARRLQHGELSYADAPGAVIDGVLGQHFAHLDADTRAAMGDALREALIEDSFFVIEIESAIGQALMRVR